jgi:hypothetical protein
MTSVWKRPQRSASRRAGTSVSISESCVILSAAKNLAQRPP